ncbi:glycosyltransferase family 2 protein [Pontiella sulfatireligans]|uniref:Poly-beta-1,6-N-acetyl-D-glucosamine synthase n=1 Tax=Pontiella sulfatireligans TaxID=2750658 RepID=A0A6C2UQX9_9BACT|nr:glycosyltransferase family 2 protein [Pontiella sulfatireligans]VGO21671.1 Poly-beta-1,6-N-acetyl-D-glucosamine synthase [Pontiella sulfatireligans]
MKASFVIATYNRADDLQRCLDSVLKQENCEIEVIVVDDASKDETCEMVKSRYGNGVQLISRETNCGSIRNRNHGAKLATGDVLFLIDDDTEFPGINTVGETIAEFDDPRVGAVAIPYLQDGMLHHAGPLCLDYDRYVVASYVGCACAVRRSTFLSLGGYEEFFHHGVEEDDFCIRMINEGMFCIIGKVSEPMVHYESTVRNLFNWDYYPRRSSILYIWKNCPLAYLVPNLAMTTIRGGIHCFKVKRVRGNIRGLWDGYASILKSMVGKGCRRKPVRSDIYRLALKLRKNPVLLTQINQ